MLIFLLFFFIHSFSQSQVLCVSTDCKSIIQLPQDTLSLNGNVISLDSNFKTLWELKSGLANVVITNPFGLSTPIGNLNAGIYIFSLTATGKNSSLINYDTLIVLPANKIPKAVIIPSDTSITLPNNTVTLDGGSSNDSDGLITNYKWSTGDTTKSIKLIFGAAGTYNYSLIVTDDEGATNTVSTSIIVNPIFILQPIVSISGPSIVNGTSDTLVAIAIDPNSGGQIKQYGWGKLAGLGTQTIIGASTAKVIITGLQSGAYQFKVTVWNGAGLTSSAITSFTVNSSTRTITKVVTYYSDGTIVIQQ